MPETLSESTKKIQIYTCSKVFSNFNFEILRLLLIFKSLYRLHDKFLTKYVAIIFRQTAQALKKKWLKMHNKISIFTYVK